MTVATLSNQASYNNKIAFTQINNDIITDDNLTPNARWLIGYLYSMKDVQRVDPKKIYNMIGKYIGRNRIYALIKELRLQGYIIKEKFRHFVKGKWLMTYHFLLTGKNKITKMLSSMKNDRETENRDRGINTVFNIKEKEGEGEKEKSPPPHSSNNLYKKGSVLFPQSEYDDLVREFGEAKVQRTIERLNDIAEGQPSKFARYENHGYFVRKWTIEDKDKPLKKAPPLQFDQAEVISANIMGFKVLKEIFWKLFTKGIIGETSNSLQFHYNNQTVKIEVTDPDACVKVTEQLNILADMGIIKRNAPD